jgi:hypothetical protein
MDIMRIKRSNTRFIKAPLEEKALNRRGKGTNEFRDEYRPPTNEAIGKPIWYVFVIGKRPSGEAENKNINRKGIANQPHGTDKRSRHQQKTFKCSQYPVQQAKKQELSRNPFPNVPQPCIVWTGMLTFPAYAF